MGASADEHDVLFFAPTAAEPAEPTFPSWMGWSIAAACLLAAFALIYALHRYGGRERALRRIAAAEGLQFLTTDPAGLARLRFPTFTAGRGVRISNVLSAAGQGDRARAFDFAVWHENTRDGDGRDPLAALADEAFGFEPVAGSRTTRSYSATRSGAVVRVDAFLPVCSIMPATAMTRAFESMGVADIDFESDEFNRGWDVRCADRRFAALFVDSQLIDLVLTLADELGTRAGIETFGNYVLITTRLCRPHRQLHVLRAAERIPQVLNPLVCDEYPTVTAMQARSSLDAWSARPDGRGGHY